MAARSWEEKREERFRNWLSAPGVQFVSPAAEQGYRARLTRIIRAIQVQEPDRVPCILPAGQFPAHYAGITVRTAMYDYEEMKRAWRKFLYDFDGDTCVIPGVSVTSGRASEITKTRISKWPGHGLPEDAGMAQFVEGEYMKADEYDALLKDPADFFMRVYLPRTMEAFEPFRKLPPFKFAFGMPMIFLGVLHAARQSRKPFNPSLKRARNSRSSGALSRKWRRKRRPRDTRRSRAVSPMPPLT